MDIDLSENEVTRTIREEGENELNMEVRVEPDTVKRELQRTFDNLQDQVDVPGFRQGKAPLAVLKKKYGQIVKDDLLKRMMEESLRISVQEEDLELVGEPEFINQPSSLNEEEGLEFTVNLETKPQVTVGNYSEVEVQKPPVSVTDEDVENAIENARQEHAELTWIEEGTIEKDDVIIADVNLEIDGEEVESDENVEIQVGENIRIFNVHHPDLWKELEGLKTGDTHEVSIDMPEEDLEPEEFRGKPATVTLTIHEIKRPELPELDEEFVERFDCDSAEEFREKVRKEVREWKEQQQEEELQNRVLDELVERAGFDIPDRLLEKGHREFLKSQQMRMTRAGVPDSVIQEKIEEHREDSKASIEQHMKRKYIMDAVAEREKIYVTEEELQEYIEHLAGQQDKWPHELKEELEENNQLDQLRSELKESKVKDFLLEQVTIVEEEEE